MSPLTIYQDDYDDATIVSNLFIDEYMKDANDAQLKVFLYLIRMMSSHKVTSISDIADKFNYTEKDILRALKYWEKNKLLALDYDDTKNLVGIHLQPILHKPAVEAASLAVPVISSREIMVPAVSVPEPVAESRHSYEKISYEKPSCDKPSYDKPSYSLDDLKAFKEAEETSQLLFVVEQYLGKTLSASEIKTILFFSDTLHFSMDLIDYLIQYCVERGKKDFRYIEKVAVSWAEEGITTPKQAARAAGKYDRIVYDIMKALGRNGTPTKAEATYILRWTRELGFSADILFEACERTAMATEKHRFEYCNTILVNWKSQNVRHKADIKQLDSIHARSKEISHKELPNKATTNKDALYKDTSLPVKTPAAAGKFNQFKQNHYDFDALEKEILSN